MAALGQRLPPAIPLRDAHDRAMTAINECRDRVAVFFIAGNIASTKSDSEQFERNIKRLTTGLVGVYDAWADSRHVLDDLQTFYEPTTGG